MGRVEKIKPGDGITAKFLNKLGDGVNSHDEGVNPPQSVQEGVPEAADEPVPVFEYIEQSRTVVQVQIFDQNDENYALIDRIETVTLQNSEGEMLRLRFKTDL